MLPNAMQMRCENFKVLIFVIVPHELNEQGYSFGQNLDLFAFSIKSELVLRTNPGPDPDPQMAGSEVSDPDSDPQMAGSEISDPDPDPTIHRWIRTRRIRIRGSDGSEL